MWKKSELQTIMEEYVRMDPKLWKPLELPLGLWDALERLTKDELTVIRKKLSLQGGSSLNKSELVRFLQSRIPGSLGSLMALWDEDRMRQFKKIADRGGVMYPEMTPQQVDYYVRRGLLAAGLLEDRPVIVMPEEVLRAYKSLDLTPLREAAARNTQWSKLANGLLFYYGVLSREEVLDRLEKLTGAAPHPRRFMEVMEDLEEYRESALLTEGEFCHPEVEDADFVLDWHLSRPELPYYPFTKQQLLQAGETGYEDRNPAFQGFVQYLMKTYDTTREEAEETVIMSVYYYQLGELPAKVMEIMGRDYELGTMAEAAGFMDHLVRLYNHTRLRYLKGYSPDGLGQLTREAASSSPAGAVGMKPAAVGSVIDFASAAAKPGRNEPCPCGSGKKYKKCCGG